MHNKTYLITLAFIGLVATHNSHAMLRQLQSSRLITRLKETSVGTKLALAGTAIAATAGIVWAVKKHREDLKIKKIIDILPPKLVGDRINCERIATLAEPKGFTVTLKGLLVGKKTQNTNESYSADLVENSAIHSYHFNPDDHLLNIYIHHIHGCFIVKNYNILSGKYIIEFHGMRLESGTNLHALSTEQGTLSAKVQDVYGAQKLSLHYVPR